MGREFVQIGNVRFKRSNISAFGIATGTRQVGLEIGFWRFVTACVAVMGSNARPHAKYRYLFVTTYQKENYKFPEDEINIDAVMADLEKGA